MSESDKPSHFKYVCQTLEFKLDPHHARDYEAIPKQAFLPDPGSQRGKQAASNAGVDSIVRYFIYKA